MRLPRRPLLAALLLALPAVPLWGCTAPNPDLEEPADLAGAPDLRGPDPRPADLTDPPPPADQATPMGELRAEPVELVFSTVRGGATAPQGVTLSARSGPVTVAGVATDGAGAVAFPADTPTLPATLADGKSLTVPVRFAPAGNQSGVLTARLLISYGPNARTSLVVGLYGLSTLGQMGNNEPPLQQVVQVLGYAINVGSSNLVLGTGAAPLGDEVSGPLFRRAAAGSVTLRPVARYSTAERLIYGVYTLPDPPTRRQLGVLRDGVDNAQTLNPPVEAGATLSFDPGDTRFGVYTQSQARVTYSEDRLNKNNSVQHAVRVYPLKDRGGAPLANQYLLAFEESSNGDYQDYVFVLSNVRFP